MSTAHVNSTSGFKRYALNSATSTAYTITKSGLYIPSGIPNGVHPIGNDLVTQIIFAGIGNNTDFKFRLWFAYRMLEDDRTINNELLLQFAGDGQATVGNTGAPAGGSGLVGTLKLCDTLTFTPSTAATTPKGPFTPFETGLAEGTNQVYSPTNDECAVLLIPSVGRATGLVIDFDCDAGSAATAGANAYILGKPA